MVYTNTYINLFLLTIFGHGLHKNLHIYLFLLTIFGPIYYGPP